MMSDKRSGISVLHVVDSTTSPDAMDVLALLLARLRGVGEKRVSHWVIVLGHAAARGGGEVAGIDVGEWGHVVSRGWADPTGWRGLSRMLGSGEFTHLYAWGMSGFAAGSMVRTGVRRVMVMADEPTRKQLRLMRVMESSGLLRGKGKHAWEWVATSSTVERALLAGGMAPERVKKIRPGVASGGAGNVAAAKAALGIGPGDGPVMLIGGDGENARHDMALWAAAILQQIFPGARAVVRTHPTLSRLYAGGAGGGLEADPGLDRFRGALPNDRILVEAPAWHWRSLLPAADLMLYTGDRAVGTSSLLYAMAAGVPIIATPSAGASELVEHQHNGLLTTGASPREIASRLEQFMGDSTLRWPLTDRARAEVFKQFSATEMVEGFGKMMNVE